MIQRVAYYTVEIKRQYGKPWYESYYWTVKIQPDAESSPEIDWDMRGSGSAMNLKRAKKFALKHVLKIEKALGKKNQVYGIVFKTSGIAEEVAKELKSE